MHEGQVTITPHLWKEILWDRAKNYTLWKYLKTYLIILVAAVSGMLSIYILTKDKSLLELIYVSIGVWFILLSYRVLKIFLNIRAIKEDHSFYVSLNQQGVQISQKLTPWEHYTFYIEHDNYLEIHDIENNISYLPKTNDIDEIISFTKTHIPQKI